MTGIAPKPVGAELARNSAITFNIDVSSDIAIASKLGSYRSVLFFVDMGGAKLAGNDTAICHR
jgi:hypothetical protein